MKRDNGRLRIETATDTALRFIHSGLDWDSTNSAAQIAVTGPDPSPPGSRRWH
jgi:hypothetical protein